MKLFITICFSLVIACCVAQSDVDKLTATVKGFHMALVKKDLVSINGLTDIALSYGHSNGWVETKADIVKDLETGYIIYQSFKEDSITVSINGTMANVRFLADVTATLKGAGIISHLKVLEVWTKRGEDWYLFARQAVKVQ
ncbi:MAG: nuclear transport factor 2 family protein [Ferruginibacter sp.]